MRSFSEMKNSALKVLDGNWGQYVGLTFVFYVITIVVSVVAGGDPRHPNPLHNTLGLVASLALIPLSYGFAVLFLNAFRGWGERVRMSNLFDGYRDFGRVFLTLLIQGIYTVLWSLLFVIPGIIKALSYTMTVFVLNDEPGLSYDAAITRSSKLMDGHKLDFFLFSLSFIGWWLLSLLTFGIGFLWLVPYYSTAKAAFYHELLEEEERNRPTPPRGDL